MATNNSFKKLMEETETQYPHPPPQMEKDVMGTTRVIRFMTDIVELYLPRVFEVFMVMAGGGEGKAPDARGNVGKGRPSNNENKIQ